MRKIEILDWSRFLAVACVMLFHYFFNGIHNQKISSIGYVEEIRFIAQYGYLGVEFFFMISGYVIFFSAREKSASQFILSRAIRLYPAFWFSVLVTSCFAVAWGAPQMGVTLKQVLVNLTMFPDVLYVGYVDGVYWTLRYEWNFYFLVFLLLMAGQRRHLGVFFLVWPVYIIVARLLNISGLPYSHGYYAYFAAGAAFAMLHSAFSWHVIAAVFFDLYLCLSFSIGKVSMLSAAKGSAYSGAVIGAVILAFFALFAAIGVKKVRELHIPGSEMAGGLTYPIYLVHAHVGYMLLSRFANEENKIQVYIVVVGGVLAVAYALHRWVEKGMAPMWRGLFYGGVGGLFAKIEAFWRSRFPQSIAK